MPSCDRFSPTTIDKPQPDEPNAEQDRKRLPVIADHIVLHFVRHREFDLFGRLAYLDAVYQEPAIRGPKPHHRGVIAADKVRILAEAAARRKGFDLGE